MSYTDPYKGKTNEQVQAMLDAELKVEADFVANLQPGEYIGAKPNMATVLDIPGAPRVNGMSKTQQRDAISYTIASYIFSLSSRGVKPKNLPQGRT